MDSESLRFCRVVLWLGRLHGVFPYDKELNLSKQLVVYSIVVFLTEAWWTAYALLLLSPAYQGVVPALPYGFNAKFLNLTEALLFSTHAVCFLNSLSSAQRYRSVFERLDDVNRKFRRLGVVIGQTNAPLHRELCLTFLFLHTTTVIFVCTMLKRGERWTKMFRMIGVNLSASAICLSTKISCSLLQLVETQTARLSLELADLAGSPNYVGRAHRVELLVRLYYDLVGICDLIEKRFAKSNFFVVGFIIFIVTYFIYFFVDRIKGPVSSLTYYTGNSIMVVIAFFWFQILLFILYRTDNIKGKEEEFLQRLHKMIECDQDPAIYHNEMVRLPVYTGQQMTLTVGGAAPLDFTLLLTNYTSII